MEYLRRGVTGKRRRGEWEMMRKGEGDNF